MCLAAKFICMAAIDIEADLNGARFARKTEDSADRVLSFSIDFAFRADRARD